MSSALLKKAARRTTPGTQANQEEISVRVRSRSFSALLVFLILTLAGPSSAVAQKMRVHILDVGQGSAAILEFPCAAILVDTGGETNNAFDSTDSLIDEIEDFFLGRPDLGGTFHSIVLSHPHIDHTRGVKAVLKQYKVLNAITNGQEVSSGKAGQKALHKKVAESEQTGSPNDNIGFEPIRVRDIPRGQGLTNEIIDPVKCANVDPKITALWGSAPKTQEWTKKDFENQNNHSVVLRVDFGRASMLLTGDLEERGIEGLLTLYRNAGRLDVDVYLVGHHGAANATTEAFLRAVTPDIAVMSMGPPFREALWTAWAHGHPRKVTVDLLTRHVRMTRPTKRVPVATGVKAFVNASVRKAIYATGWDGTITLEADVDGTWKVLGDRTLFAGDSADPQALVNINSASADELGELPMVGKKRAGDIVEYRSRSGPFASVEDIGKVPGIGPGTLKVVRPLMAVGSAAPVSAPTMMAAAPVEPGELLTNQAVVDMVRAGIGDSVILAKIAATKAQFDVGAETLIELKRGGVSDPVLAAMIGKR